MADTTLTSIPASLYAGDTLAWLLTDGDYPATDGWGITFGFRAHQSSAIDLVSAADGANHLVSASAAITATWLPAVYKGVARVSDGTIQRTKWKGTIEVLPGLIEAGDNYDTRSNARICLDALDAVMAGKATREVLNTTIAGQSIGRMSWTEMIAAKNYYADIVAGEQAIEDAANGKTSSRNIFARFRNAT